MRIFGCQCFVHQPEEIRRKGAARRFEAIFVGYIENHLGWLVRDLYGKLFFSRDVIFNESVPSHLSPNRGCSIQPESLTPAESDAARRPHTRSMSLIAEVIQDCDSRLAMMSLSPHPQQSYQSVSTFIDLNHFTAFVSSCFHSEPDPMIFQSTEFCFATSSRYPFRFRIQDYDPDKAPDSYEEAMAQPDKDVWIAAMQCEKDSLEERGSFERVTPIPKV